jgi:hypothetical protein
VTIQASSWENDGKKNVGKMMEKTLGNKSML